jgi:hypothetical protein
MNYEQKYLKYKQKYLELKKLVLKGGVICSLCLKEKAITHTCNSENVDYSICAGCSGRHYRLVHCGINPTCLAGDGQCYEKIKFPLGNGSTFMYIQGNPLDEKCCNNPKSDSCPQHWGHHAPAVVPNPVGPSIRL